MAATGGRSDPSLIESLASDPERFEFIQAVRVLERAAALAAQKAGMPAANPRVGLDADPREEAVLLRASLDLAFPASEISGFEPAAEGRRPTLNATFLGLVGPSGVLPAHYSQVVQEAQRDKNLAMRDFFDLFDHRALSFFVRAAEKYRAASSYERTGGQGSDTYGGALYSLIGLGQPSLRHRQAAPDASLAFYAGHYAHRPRTAEGLAQILSDYFERPARVTQFMGRWARLPPPEQTRLTRSPRPGFGGMGGTFSQLGVDAVCGAMVFDVQGSFRVGLGPLDYEQFASFLPDTPQMAALIALARTYAGPAFSFDVQLTLKADAVPTLVLGGAAIPPRLGWNTWLPIPERLTDADDPVFEAEAA